MSYPDGPQRLPRSWSAAAANCPQRCPESQARWQSCKQRILMTHSRNWAASMRTEFAASGNRKNYRAPRRRESPHRDRILHSAARRAGQLRRAAEVAPRQRGRISSLALSPTCALPWRSPSSRPMEAEPTSSLDVGSLNLRLLFGGGDNEARSVSQSG